MDLLIRKRAIVFDVSRLYSRFPTVHGFTVPVKDRQQIVGAVIIEAITRAYGVTPADWKLYMGYVPITGYGARVCDACIRGEVGTNKTEEWIQEVTSAVIKGIMSEAIKMFREYYPWPETIVRDEDTSLLLPIALDHGWTMRHRPPKKTKTGRYLPPRVIIEYPVVVYEGKQMSVNSFLLQFSKHNCRRKMSDFFIELLTERASQWIDKTHLATTVVKVK